MKELVDSRDISAIREQMLRNGLVIKDNKIVPRDEDSKTKIQQQITFWNQRQNSRKLLLNSLYGAMLNENCLFFDERIGQSTTLSGRSIVRHMNAQINQIVSGEYDHQGEGIIYADTDSCYFSAYKVLKDHPDFCDCDWSAESVIAMYDAIAEETNTTFTDFMEKTFNTSTQRGSIIRAGRELVARTGLFIKKKKYAVLMIDKEGTRLDVDGKPGKLKPMGLDLKRSDTPKVMQQFLEKLLMDLLTGVPQTQIFADIRDFRRVFKTQPAWTKGSPKKVANLASFTAKVEGSNRAGLSLTTRRTDRVNLPGHVLASINWNRLCEVNDDRYVNRITDSNRIIVCKLKKNTLGMTSVAYPIDEPHLPRWFTELPFNDEAMEETIIDNKIMNLCGVLGWDLTDTKIRGGDDLFSWS